MSQENAEVVRRMWEAFLRRDFEDALSAFDPDVEWDGTNLPDGGVSRGHEAVRDHAASWAGTWDSWTVELGQFIEAGDEVVLFIREKGLSKSGIEMDERHAEVYTVKDGKILRRKGFSDVNEALEVVGLSK
jgi:ketosteroid isomerase-like protein